MGLIANPAGSRLLGLLAGLAAVAAAAAPSGAAAASPGAWSSAGGPSAAAAAAKVARYWTPERMRNAAPLEYEVGADGRGHLVPGAPEIGGASASFKTVPTPDVPPYSFNGRIFLRQGNLQGYCSGTAINSPTRQLVLTAGHCVGSGPENGHGNIRSNFLVFVPAYTDGLAPFGAFVAIQSTVKAPRGWIKQGNPDFDMGAFLTSPNSEGINLADAVGGGATIVTGLTRKQDFLTFGYPGNVKRLQGCNSPYLGDDVLTNPFPGPPTLGIRCHWAPGASGGGWLINGGAEINGINTYLHFDNKSRTYGPYFSKETVGKLVKGL